jgi:Rrf2 family nitric oxide-sensitive transcriptional repressor
MALISQIDGRATATEIAEQTCVPVRYMSKVLQTLSEAGLVESQRGPTGGFWLSKSADDITLLDVVDCIEPIERITTCPINLPEHCDNLCPLHVALDDLAVIARQKLGGTSLAAVMDKSIVPLGIKIKGKPDNAGTNK